MLKLIQTMENAYAPTVRESKYVVTAFNGNVRLEDETISFKLQAGNVADFGVNGVQCEEILQFTKTYLQILNSHHSSVHNEGAIAHIESAIRLLNLRTADRVNRGVEGKELD